MISHSIVCRARLITNFVHTLHRVKFFPVATRSFGAIGVFAIPEMGRFYRHVLVEKGNFPHHGAVAFGHFGKELFEVFKYIGVPVDEIGYNQPAGVRYPTENPWG